MAGWFAVSNAWFDTGAAGGLSERIATAGPARCSSRSPQPRSRR